MNSYEAKQEARRTRLSVRADRLRTEGQRRITRSMEIAHSWPMGQPILVGHHSEKRHRRDIKRMDDNMRAGIVATKAADELERRAAGVGTAGISSDDPDALVKLREKLAAMEASRDRMKASNAAHRASGAEAPYTYGLTNLGANIRRVRDRIEQLERATKRATVERMVGHVRVLENVDDNRLQAFFPAKPPAATIAALKSAGFRWSPSAGAWQRQLNNSARWALQRILE